jgi:hypothetical protein
MKFPVVLNNMDVVGRYCKYVINNAYNLPDMNGAINHCNIVMKHYSDFLNGKKGCEDSRGDC